MDLSFPLIPVPGRQYVSLTDAWQGAKQALAALIILWLEEDMAWVCAECGGDLIYPDVRCIKDETHRGQMKLEDFEAKQERKEVMEREAKEAVELLFGPRDLL